MGLTMEIASPRISTETPGERRWSTRIEWVNAERLRAGFKSRWKRGRLAWLPSEFVEANLSPGLAI